PSYLTSEWCKKELEQFLNIIQGQPTSSARLCAVVVRPIEHDLLPHALREIQYVSFVDEAASAPFEPASPEWVERLRQSADALRRILRELRDQAPKHIDIASASTPESRPKLTTKPSPASSDDDDDDDDDADDDDSGEAVSAESERVSTHS